MEHNTLLSDGAVVKSFKNALGLNNRSKLLFIFSFKTCFHVLKLFELFSSAITNCCDLFLAGMARFFHNGYYLRKDVIIASIQKIKEILQWFESQKHLNFYASSLLFVYDGSSQMTWLNESSLSEKRRVSKGQGPGGNTMEYYNNNIHVINSPENGKLKSSVGRDFSKIYALHKRHQSQISLKAETVEQDNLWKSSACFSQEHLNGNVIPQLEKVFCYRSMMEPGSAVEVRMIDFAHVFPSNTGDEGYIHGLKNLITVLQNILDT